MKEGNISLFKAKLYVALTFKVLSWLDLKYEVGADDCKMLLAGRKPFRRNKSRWELIRHCHRGRCECDCAAGGPRPNKAGFTAL